MIFYDMLKLYEIYESSDMNEQDLYLFKCEIFTLRVFFKMYFRNQLEF